jgi:transcriptional regulator with XRE-family HTH domain
MRELVGEQGCGRHPLGLPGAMLRAFIGSSFLLKHKLDYRPKLRLHPSPESRQGARRYKPDVMSGQLRIDHQRFALVRELAAPLQHLDANRAVNLAVCEHAASLHDVSTFVDFIYDSIFDIAFHSHTICGKRKHSEDNPRVFWAALEAFIISLERGCDLLSAKSVDACSTIMEKLSIMVDATLDLNRRVAERVRELRGSAGLSLDGLASKSGVSRSMISLIERGESSPTAIVLEKLAASLGVTLASLFDGPAAGAKVRGPVARRADQPEWRDPASGYVRRNISPAGMPPQPFQIVEVHFPAGRRVAFETGARDMRIYQQVWLLEGKMDITVGEEHLRLREGDCLAMQLDQPTMFHNPTRKRARYAVVIGSESSARR